MKKINKIFEDILSRFPGAGYGVCLLDFSKYRAEGYNYAIIIYHPYEDLMKADRSYDEMRQRREELRLEERTRAIKKEFQDVCKAENIPFFIPPGVPTSDMPPYRSLLSAKYIGWRSGIGWIGKNDLLITYEYGARIDTICGVFSADYFPVRNPVTVSGCGDCDLCVKACPFQNIKGNIWTPRVSRDELVDYENCCRIRTRISEKKGLDHKYRCGRCLLACPKGTENIQKFMDACHGK